jgi:hypothetical protein
VQRNTQTDTFALDVGRAQALRMLVAGATLTAVQRELGISRATLYRWRQDLGFQLAFHAAVRARLPRQSARVDLLFDDAVAVLEDFIRDPTAPPAVRAFAANAVLEHARQEIEPPKGPQGIKRSSISSLRALIAGMAKATR